VPSPLDTTSPFVTNYIPPAPPPGSAPHRYVFLLYEQPAGFDAAEFAPAQGGPGTEVPAYKRMWFDLDAWEKKAGLGDVVAFNYFVSN
jgi:phosphatidylethanolamine-binding protein